MSFFNKNSISHHEAYKRMEEGGKYILLDVRTPEEYNMERLKGAKLIPVDELAARAPKDLPDKNATILVYCQSGIRAKSAVKLLIQMGYKDVNCFGGIANWPYEKIGGSSRW